MILGEFGLGLLFSKKNIIHEYATSTILSGAQDPAQLHAVSAPKLERRVF